MIEINFDDIVANTLKHEGGFVDDPVDTGGATKWGISLRFAMLVEDIIDMDLDDDGDVDVDDIKLITRSIAKGIYKAQFWEKYRYWKINSVPIAQKVFDLSVNMGPYKAHLVLQRALRAVNHKVTQDGKVGPKTFEATNNVIMLNKIALISSMKAEAAGMYRVIIAKHSAFKKYENGWLNRAYS